MPACCKWLCPAGTSEAGIPLAAMDASLRGALGLLFAWKLFVLIAILLWASVPVPAIFPLPVPPGGHIRAV